MKNSTIKSLNLGITFGKVLVVLLFLGVSFMAAGQTMNICANSVIPAGYVIISSQSSTDCGVFQKYTIQNISGMGSGSSIDVCANSPIPPGWVITHSESCTCCGVFQKVTIKNINGMGTGTVLEVCASSNIPKGWITTKAENCSCCGVFQKLTIKNVNCVAIGTTLDICSISFSNLPEGEEWLILSDAACSCCAPTTKRTVQKVSGFTTPTVSASNAVGCSSTAISLVGTPTGGVFSVPNPYSGPSTSYTYTFTNAGGCSASTSANITVNPLPQVMAFDVSGCTGSPIELLGTPSGGTWSVPNPYTGSSTTYTHSFTDANGCTNTSPPANITTHPSAAETCNGVDDNCNGQSDEGNVCGQNNDIDGDTYTIAEGDCNDNNAAIHPNAPEICNGIDDNCDGIVDYLPAKLKEWQFAKTLTTGILVADKDGNFYGLTGNPPVSQPQTIVKYDGFGNSYWTKSITHGPSPSSVYSTSGVSDAFGNLYVGGEFKGTCTFDNIVITCSTSDKGVFVAKYNAQGDILWVTTSSNSGSSSMNGSLKSIAADGFGNVYITGGFSSSIVFGNTSLTSFGSGDMFIVKYDPSGNVIWAKKSDQCIEDDLGRDLATDASGNVYVCGTFSSCQSTSQIKFGNAAILTTLGSEDIFIVKYDASGNVTWSKKAGGSSVIPGSCGSCLGSCFNPNPSMIVDPSGNAYLSGSFNLASCTIGNFTLFKPSDLYINDRFLAKYDQSGNVLWASKVEGSKSINAADLTGDQSGNTYLAGYTISPSITFGNLTLTNSDSTLLFIIKYNSSGVPVYANGIGSCNAAAIGGLASNPKGELFLAGFYYCDSLNFGDLTLINPVPPYGGKFVAKYGPADTISVRQVAFSYCPGQSASVSYMAGGNFNQDNIFTAQLSDASGSFNSPINIGSINSISTCGAISVTIPLSTAPGNSYRIRVISSNAAVTGSDNGSNITIGTISTYYADTDHDSYGDLDGVAYACSLPSGYVEDSTDCDDANANVHPGALELCNSIDDDCDHQTDEDGPLTLFADADGDGYGDPNFSLHLCVPQSGFVSNSFDCDDNNSSISPAAIPTKQWDKRFGGTSTDKLSYTQQTSDGGYILGGWSKSPLSGDKSEDNWDAGTLDFWVVKTDASGVKQWDKRFGGTADDGLIALQQTSDGGYILGGYSYSVVSGDKTAASRGLEDYWVVKIDANGNKLWDAAFGGSDYDELQALQQTSDGGYIFGGYSVSGISGDRSQSSQGGQDYWIIKTDAGGVKQWDRRFGGISTDGLYSLKQTSDGGYILGGRSFSGISGDKSQASQGLYDYWIIRIDAAGNKVWDKSFGGSGDDYFTKLLLATDGGYLLAGYSNSGLSGDKSQASQGNNDYWVVKTDGNGIKEWDVRYGGTGDDQCFGFGPATDGGYILGGRSKSGLGGDKSQANLGQDDFWIVKADGNGVKQWDRTYGGTKNDVITGMQQSSDGGYMLGGYSFSDISTDKTQPNWDASLATNDYWIIKLGVSNGLQQFYADADGDGYGLATSSVFACNQPLGFASISGDCNDANAAMNPGAVDMCNGIDDNCSGVTDENAINATITPGGAVSTCSGVDITLAANEGTGTITYQWLKNTAAISGASNATYATSKAGNYQVTLTNNSFGCISTSIATTVSVISGPSATITPLGNLDICGTGSVVLQANGGTGLQYQWKKGTSIVGTAQTYTATQSGTYKVTVTKISNGCSKTSAGTKVTKSCKEGEVIEEAITSKLSIYPNPTSGKFIIELVINETNGEAASIEVFNTIGQIVYSENVSIENGLLKKEINLDHSLANGMYLVKVTVNNKIYSTQIIYQQ